MVPPEPAGLDAHAASCTLAMILQAGRRLKDRRLMTGLPVTGPVALGRYHRVYR